MEKWHDLIGAATELLRQTEHSLQDLQKSIHPLALQKMRGLMFLQNEDWERILTLSSSSSHNNNNYPPPHHNYKPPPDKPQPKHFYPDQTQPSNNIKPPAMSTSSESTSEAAKSNGHENLVKENQQADSPPEGYQQPILHQE